MSFTFSFQSMARRLLAFAFSCEAHTFYFFPKALLFTTVIGAKKEERLLCTVSALCGGKTVFNPGSTAAFFSALHFSLSPAIIIAPAVHT